MLTPTGTSEKRQVGKRMRWFDLCTCSCGKTVWILRDNHKSGNTTSCGCFHQLLRAEMGRKHRKHGKALTRIYHSWWNMIRRCTDPGARGYPRYGGRGITVCARWRKSFEAFAADMGEPPSDQHQLDRYPDNNGPYEPGNCRWATRHQNSRNKRNNRLITFRGETRCLAEWAERLAVSQSRIRRLLARGLTLDSL